MPKRSTWSRAPSDSTVALRRSTASRSESGCNCVCTWVEPLTGAVAAFIRPPHAAGRQSKMSDEDDIHEPEPEHDHLLDNDYLEDERDEDTFGALDEPDTCGTGRRRSCEYCDAVQVPVDSEGFSICADCAGLED